MERIEIPLENWLGEFGEKDKDGKIPFKETQFLKPERVSGLTITPEEFSGKFSNRTPLEILVLRNFISDINWTMDNDETLWPEGIRRDLSNFWYRRNEAGGYHFILLLTEEDCEFFELPGDEPVVFVFNKPTLTLPVWEGNKFLELILDVQEPITNPSTQATITPKKHPTGPKIRYMVLKDQVEESENTISDELSFISVAGYINSIYPGIINEDMVTKMTDVYESETEVNGNVVRTLWLGFKILGKTFALGADWDPHFVPVTDEGE